MEILQLLSLTSPMSGEYPATELLSTVNSTIAPSLSSLARRTRLNCQPSTEFTLPSQSQSHVATDGQSVSKPRCGAPSGAHDQIFITAWQLRSWFCGAPSLTRGRVCLCICYWPLPVQSFSGRCPLGLATVFYCLRFETSLFVASYYSQGHGGVIRLRLHTGVQAEYPNKILLLFRSVCM
jgi:hypothetical protein